MTPPGSLMHRHLTAAILFLAALPRLCLGQEPACSYDQCAISIESKLFSTRLVAGREARPVARLGLFPPWVPAFEHGSDSTRHHYLAFRSAQRSGAWLTVASLAALTAAVFVAADNSSHRSVTRGLVAGGVVLSLGAGISLRRGSNHLARAIWWHNRGLPANRP